MVDTNEMMRLLGQAMVRTRLEIAKSITDDPEKIKELAKCAPIKVMHFRRYDG